MDGATNVVDARDLRLRHTRGDPCVPGCDWTPDNARKGWDGCIYGNVLPRKATKQTKRRVDPHADDHSTDAARTTLDLLASDLATIAFDNPSIARPAASGAMATSR